MLLLCARVKDGSEGELREKFLIQQGIAFIPCFFGNRPKGNFSSLVEHFIPGSLHFCLCEQKSEERGFKVGYFKFLQQKFVPIFFVVESNGSERHLFSEKEIYSIFVHVSGNVEIKKIILGNDGVFTETIRERIYLEKNYKKAVPQLIAEKICIPPKALESLVSYIFTLRQGFAEKDLLEEFSSNFSKS
jgi:hypothetical protein